MAKFVSIEEARKDGQPLYRAVFMNPSGQIVADVNVYPKDLDDVILVDEMNIMDSFHDALRECREDFLAKYKTEKYQAKV